MSAAGYAQAATMPRRGQAPHAWVRESGRIECARCGMRAHWQGASEPCGATSLGAKRAEEVRAAIRLRGVPDEVAEAERRVFVLGEMA